MEGAGEVEVELADVGVAEEGGCQGKVNAEKSNSKGIYDTIENEGAIEEEKQVGGQIFQWEAVESHGEEGGFKGHDDEDCGEGAGKELG